MNFADFVRSAGLIPRDIVPDGRWYRCSTETHTRKRNGAYKLAADGRIGWARDWAIHSEPLRWMAGKDQDFDIDRPALRKHAAEDRAMQVRATQEARKFYLGCAPLRDGHPYLAAHGLDMVGCFGLRVDTDGWLVVPMYRETNLMSVQRIAPDGRKLFWKHAPAKGACYVIERRNASLQVLCEGLATGLALFAACPLCRVICAFSAGNLGNVEIPRQGLGVVASDNDHETEAKIGTNPGVVAATEAAEALGVGVAIPTEMRGTDFADLRQERMRVLLAERPKEREGNIRRSVDAEIAATLMRQARFLHA